VDRVAVRDGVRQPLEDDHAAPLSAHGAVGARVEGVAAAVGGQRARAGEGERAVRGQVQVDAAGQRQAGGARQQGLAGQVDGDEGGGLGRVHGQAGPAQAEVVGDAVGDDAPAQAGHRVVRHGVAAVAVHQRGVVVAGRPEEDRGTAAAQGARQDPGVLQRRPAQFERQPLPRVHRLGLARRDAEEGGVEVGHPVQEAAAPQPRWLRAVRYAVRAPAPGRHLGDGVHAVAQQAPEGVDAVGSRNPAGHADDRDRALAGSAGGHGSCSLLPVLVRAARHAVSSVLVRSVRARSRARSAPGSAAISASSRS
jgi:hypothetical protein